MQSTHYKKDRLTTGRVLVGELKDIQIITRCVTRILLDPRIANVEPVSQVGVCFSKACSISKNCIQRTVAKKIWERGDYFLRQGSPLSEKREAKCKDETNKNPSNPESVRFEHGKLLYRKVKISRANYTRKGSFRSKNVIIICNQDNLKKLTALPG